MTLTNLQSTRRFDHADMDIGSTRRLVKERSDVIQQELWLSIPIFWEYGYVGIQ